jgi:hypothetical protein
MIEFFMTIAAGAFAIILCCAAIAVLIALYIFFKEFTR